MRKIVLGLAATACVAAAFTITAASAQMTIRRIQPVAPAAPQTVPENVRIAPDWLAPMKALSQRVATLEAQLAQSNQNLAKANQDLAALRAEYGAHHHEYETTRFGIGQGENGLKITNFNAHSKEATGTPLQ